MTKKEKLVEKLKEASKLGAEEGHLQMDRALLEYVNDLEVTKIFCEFDKWYS